MLTRAITLMLPAFCNNFGELVLTALMTIVQLTSVDFGDRGALDGRAAAATGELAKEEQLEEVLQNPKIFEVDGVSIIARMKDEQQEDHTLAAAWPARAPCVRGGAGLRGPLDLCAVGANRCALVKIKTEQRIMANDPREPAQR